MEFVFSYISDLKLSLMECLSLALLFACFLCGLMILTSKRLNRTNKTAISIFFGAFTIFLLEIIILIIITPQKDNLKYFNHKLIEYIVIIEIITIFLFIIITTLSYLPSIARLLGIYEIHGDVDLRPSDNTNADSSLRNQNMGGGFFILPDMTDEEIEVQLAARNSQISG
jgi:hypothetical protein